MRVVIVASGWFLSIEGLLMAGLTDSGAQAHGDRRAREDRAKLRRAGAPCGGDRLARR
jgi:hypothetical protein